MGLPMRSWKALEERHILLWEWVGATHGARKLIGTVTITASVTSETLTYFSLQKFLSGEPLSLPSTPHG